MTLQVLIVAFLAAWLGLVVGMDVNLDRACAHCPSYACQELDNEGVPHDCPNGCKEGYCLRADGTREQDHDKDKDDQPGAHYRYCRACSMNGCHTCYLSCAYNAALLPVCDGR